MNRFLKESFLVMALFTVACLALTWVAPIGWVDGMMQDKLHHIAQTQSSDSAYTHLIVGSSRVYRQIDALTVDRSAADCGLALRSFNLGIYGMFNPEGYHLSESVLGSAAHRKAIQFMTVELTDEDLQFSHHPRDNYFMTPAECWHRIRVDAQSPDLHFFERIDRAANYLKLLAMNTFHMGHRHLLAAVYHKATKGNVFMEHRGYRGLDSELEETRRSDLMTRVEEFTRDTLPALVRIRDQWNEATADPAAHLNGTELERLMAMISKAQAEGIHLFFAIHAPMTTVTPELVALHEALPPEHVLPILNPNEFPSLYNQELFFDRGHYNANGTAAYSVKFAEAFAQRVAALNR